MSEMTIGEFLTTCNYVFPTNEDQFVLRLSEVIPTLDEDTFQQAYNKGNNDLSFDNKVRIAIYRYGLKSLSIEGRYLELHPLQEVAGYVLVYKDELNKVQTQLLNYNRAIEFINNS